MKRLNKLCLILTLILFVLPGWLKAQQPVFRIGILDNTSLALSRGARLAVEKLNSSGGVRGADGTFFQLELVPQVVGAGETLDTAIANIGQSDVIAVLGPISTNDTQNSMAQLQSLNMPVLTPATGDSLLINDSTDRIFRSRAARILQGQALANYLVTERGLNNISILQLDVDSTDSAIGFSSAVQALGVTPRLLLLQSQITDLATSVVQTNPQVIVVYGAPDLGSQLITTTRQAGWNGLVAYDETSNPGFRSSIAPNFLPGLLSTTTWPFTATDAVSSQFLGDYVRRFGAIPDSISAAGYDSIQLLASAIGLPGELQSNLRRLDNIQGVQGLLRPSQLSPGETSNSVAVVELNADAVPQPVARYAGGVRLPNNQQATVATPAPPPTATPEGVVLTIKDRPFQNVRSGPSTQFDILGQLNEGDQARVIGANRGNTWVVIDFRGRQGWMSAPLLDIFGDLNTVPIIESPPTPTPGFTPTPVPPQEADIVIESASVSPSPIIVGQPFNVNVVVRNSGLSNAGQFAIAANFPPNGVFSAANIPGLGAGQAVTTTLSGTMSNTGFYSVVIVADLNNQVPEGPGEANNGNYTLSYAIDKPIIRQADAALNSGDTLDLEGNGVQGDANWNGSGASAKLDALFGAKLGIIPNVTLQTVHWDLINPGTVSQNSIPRSSMNAGTIIGIITADGNRGVIRVNNIPGDQFQVTFRVYQN